MATKVIKTAGQVAFEDFHAASDSNLKWNEIGKQAAWEAFAAKHNIQPLTEEVAEKPTDGDLLSSAYFDQSGWESIAAEFIRLRAERDGEPLPVTTDDIVRWSCKFFSSFSGLQQREFADAINQHRGVRPVTVITSYVMSNGVLHTFEDQDEMVAFTKSHDWSSAARALGHEHHPRKDGGA